MKKICRKYWPLLSLLVLLVVGGTVFGVLQLRSTPTRAVEGYLRASLKYDADELLRYASDYQIAKLSGYAEVDMNTLRKNLRKSYEDAAEYRIKGKITFRSTLQEQPEKGTQRFEQLLEEYAVHADESKVSELAVVSCTIYVDGNFYRTNRAVAVKCNGKWYYGYLLYEDHT